ncbi:MAG TPA: transposase [Bacteroidota bacterium]|nr:transposase [Bacteroidota bacterium]
MKYLDGHYYHVYNRGAHKKQIFVESPNCAYLVSLFAKYRTRYNISISAYCLMPNHYHLIARQNEEGDIGGFLRTTFNAYTQAFNKRYGHSGTLFQGQAKVKHVDNQKYCLQLVRYIHRNPIAMPFVSSLRDWEFSDYLEWIGLRPRLFADFDLRDTFFKTPMEYESFVDSYTGDTEKPLK